MPSFTPARGHYLIRKEVRTTTESGLIIPASAERHKTGIVIALGSGLMGGNGLEIPPSFKVMDRVMYFPHAGTEFEVNGEPLLILQEKEILLKIDGEVTFGVKKPGLE